MTRPVTHAAFAFSLRALFLLVVIFTISASIVGATVRCAKREEAAVASIESIAVISHDFELGRNLEYVHREPPGPSALRRLLGRYAFQHVVRVRFVFMSDAKSHKLLTLQHCPRLVEIDLSDTRCSDQGCEILSRLHSLEVLCLDKCAVTDNGIKHLARLQSIEWLSLNSTAITDTAVEYLRCCRQLECLSLGGTSLTDECLESLRGMGSLEYLNLRGTQLSQAGIDRLRSLLPRCEVVH